MRARRKYCRQRIALIALGIVVWLPCEIAAQCVMCRSTVASQSGTAAYEAVAQGLQMGILYLLVVPYASVLVIGWLWYRKTKSAAAG